MTCDQLQESSDLRCNQSDQAGSGTEANLTGMMDTRVERDKFDSGGTGIRLQ